MAIITDRHVTIYQTTITAVRDALGRTATIYLKPTTVDCVWCIWDPVYKKSSGKPASGYTWSTHPNYKNDKVCPNCDGKGVTQTENTETVKGTKKDLSYNDRADLPMGNFKPGTLRFSCDLNDVLVDSDDVDGDTHFHRAIKVVLDGESYEVVNVSKSGLRDLYTCRVILERTNK